MNRAHLLRSSLPRLLVAACCAVVAAVAQAQASLGVDPPTAAPPSDTEQLDRLVQAKRYDEALKLADKVLRAQPRNAQVRFQRAVVLADMGQRADAVAALEALTQEYPELPEPYNNLAVLQAAGGQYDVARSLLLRALTVQPNYVTAQENLGDLYVAMAVEAYAQAGKLDPASAILKAKLALVRDTNLKLRNVK